jgi:hypothetical protein
MLFENGLLYFLYYNLTPTLLTTQTYPRKMQHLEKEKKGEKRVRRKLQL